MAHALKVNSYDAHRLIALAREMGGPALEDAALERMFSAHFAEGLAIDDHDTLLRCAAEAGMDERRVGSVLADDTYGDVVREDEAGGPRASGSPGSRSSSATAASPCRAPSRSRCFSSCSASPPSPRRRPRSARSAGR